MATGVHPQAVAPAPTVLIIDDDVSVQKFAARALTGAGYWLGANFDDVEKPLGYASTSMFVLAGVWYVYRVATYRH